MKKTLITFFLITATSFIYAQSATESNNFPLNPSTDWKNDSTHTYDWLPDISMWQLSQKEFYTYNDHLSLLTSIRIFYDESSANWKNFRKELFDYYSDFSQHNKEIFFWNRRDGSWVQTSLYSNDSEGRVIMDMYRYYDSAANQFDFGTKKSKSYSLEQNVEITERIDFPTQSWINYQKETTDLEEGKDVLITEQEWNVADALWVNTEKTQKYWIHGSLSEEIDYNWETLSWIPQSKITYTYSPTGKQSGRYNYNWNPTTSSFDEDERTSITFNEDDNIAEIFEERWKPVDMIWEPYYRTTYTYYTNKQEDEEKRYEYNPATSEYILKNYEKRDSLGVLQEDYSFDFNAAFEIQNGFRFLFTYEDGLLVQHSLFSWENGGWDEKNRDVFEYDAGNNRSSMTSLRENVAGELEQFKKENYFYSEFIGIEERPAINEFCFFSNPLTPGTIVNCPGIRGDYTVTVINMSGQKVYTSRVNSGSSFRITEDLAAGNYIMMIEQAGKSRISGKIIITR